MTPLLDFWLKIYSRMMPGGSFREKSASLDSLHDVHHASHCTRACREEYTAGCRHFSPALNTTRFRSFMCQCKGSSPGPPHGPTHLSSEKHYNVFTRPSTLAWIGVYFSCAFEEKIADFTLLDLANSHVTATIVSPHTSFLRPKFSITCTLAMSASPRVTLVHLH